MKRTKIDRLIESVRKLKEEGVSGITNSVNSSSLGFDPNTETPPVRKRRRIYMKGMRSWWKQFLDK
jgi:hypothetical protein